MIIIQGAQFADGISHESLALALGIILEIILTSPFFITSRGLVSAVILPQKLTQKNISKNHLKIERLATLFTGGSNYLLEGIGNKN